MVPLGPAVLSAIQFSELMNDCHHTATRTSVSQWHSADSSLLWKSLACDLLFNCRKSLQPLLCFRFRVVLSVSVVVYQSFPRTRRRIIDGRFVRFRGFLVRRSRCFRGRHYSERVLPGKNRGSRRDPAHGQVPSSSQR